MCYWQRRHHIQRTGCNKTATPEKLVPHLFFALCLLIGLPSASWAQPSGVPEGSLTFKVIDATSADSKSPLTMLPSLPGLKGVRDASITNAAVVAIRTIPGKDICNPKKEGIKDFSVFVLQAGPKSELRVDQKSQRAYLEVRGTMKEYIPAGDYCTTQKVRLRRTSSGGFNMGYFTTAHYTPRNFFVLEKSTHQETLIKEDLKKKLEILLAAVTGGMIDHAKTIAPSPSTRSGVRLTLQAHSFSTLSSHPMRSTYSPLASGVCSGEPDFSSTLPRVLHQGGLSNLPFAPPGFNNGGFVVERGSIAYDFQMAANLVNTFKGGLDVTMEASAYSRSIATALHSMNIPNFGTAIDEMIGAASEQATLPGTAMASLFLDGVGDGAKAHIMDTANCFSHMVGSVASNFAPTPGVTSVVLKDPRQPNNTAAQRQAHNAYVFAQIACETIKKMIDSLDEDKLAGYARHVSYGQIWSEDMRSAVTGGWPTTVGGSTMSAAARAPEQPGQAGEYPDVEALLRQYGQSLPQGANGKLPPGFNMKKLLNPNATLMGQAASRVYTTGPLRGLPQISVSFMVESVKEPEETPSLSLALPVPPGPPQPEHIYHIALNGSDTNPGTEQQPFATIQRGLTQAQGDREQGHGVRLILHDGTFRQSASVNWNDSFGAPPLTIQARNSRATTLSGTNVVTSTGNSSWQVTEGIWHRSWPLHPNQIAWQPGGDPVTNPPPLVIVNGKRLFYFPAASPPGPGTYTVQSGIIKVNPPRGITSPTTAIIEVGTRPFALRLSGVRNLTLRDLTFFGFPLPTDGSLPTPGLVQGGGTDARLTRCRFQ